MRKLETLLTYIFSFILFLLITSCEDVIEVPLDDADDVLVVDAWLSTLEGEQVIRLTETQPYFDNTAPPAIENAEVQVIRNDSITLPFAYDGEGNYRMEGSVADLGNIGDTYRLNIVIDGVTITSETRMNRVPPIDSIGLEFRDDQPFSDDGLYANFYARDPIGEGDTYWIKTFANGRFLDKPEELNIAYDAAFDAGGVDGLVFITPIREFVNQTDEDDLIIPYVPGDSIRVEIHSISNAAFDFMEIASEQITNSSNGIFSIPIANAPGNVVTSDGSRVLGVFNVAAVSVAEHVVE